MACPASRCLLLCCPSKIPRVKFHSATIAHKGPNTALQSLGGARIPSAPQDGHKPPQKGRHGASCFQDEIYGYWQRKPCRKNYRLAFYFSETFWELYPLDGERLYDYGAVDFSKLPFSKLNFFKAFAFCGRVLSLLLFVLFIYFLPKSWRGAPSPDDGRHDSTDIFFLVYSHPETYSVHFTHSPQLRAILAAKEAVWNASHFDCRG